MSPDKLTAMQRRGLRALMTVGVLACELVTRLVLFGAALGASAALVPNATAADARPGVVRACEVGFWILPLLVGVAAAWRRFWVVTAVQICLVLLLLWLTL